MSHTIVTTTTTTTSTVADSGIIDMGYVRSFQAMLKIAQIVVLLIAFLCVHCAAWTDYSAYRYFEVVTVWFLITFLIFYIMYVFRLQKKIPCINWPLTEFLHYAIGTLLIFIASIVAAVNSRGYAGLVAGSVFGFFATVLLAMSIWMSYKITCGSQPTSAAV
ncbi:CKLF-like MARVEL transmembrane domain-containing protein 7 [Huso huso]|uniref:CKLF-like MARVEL transmembrane domain-containing protein 7 n=1 Tax=Huso huso TaxID=61971 RepID=A0ABR1A4B1_HUSHU